MRVRVRACVYLARTDTWEISAFYSHPTPTPPHTASPRNGSEASTPAGCEGFKTEMSAQITPVG